jgi:hypothetical protein
MGSIELSMLAYIHECIHKQGKGARRSWQKEAVALEGETEERYESRI